MHSSFQLVVRGADPRRTGSRVGAILPALAALAWAGVAGAVAWPGAAPCNGTLQACIDGVPAGSVIVMVNSVADENIEISKSLTLQSAPGKVGVIGAGFTPRDIFIHDFTADGDHLVVQLRDLVVNGSVSVRLQADAGHEVTVRGCSIRNEALSNSASGIDLDVRVPATIVADANDIETNGDGIALLTVSGSGAISATLSGNRITAVTPAVSANGVDLDLRGAGTVEAYLYSNLIYGVTGCNCGGATGIGVSVTGTLAASVGIVNNTLDDMQASSEGIEIQPPQGGGTASVSIFNNIVTHTTSIPLFLPPLTAGLLVTSGYNDFFANSSVPNYGGYPAGAGTVSVDPQYVSPALADYHLQDLSPLVDAGTPLPLGGLPAKDADGRPRTIGGAPDLGAFEVPEPAATVSAAAACVALAAVGARRRFDVAPS
jgi:hypothetical protein